MGLSPATNISDAIQLCIFDLRRGQYEGQELDKILFFYPADSPFSTQLSVIGLSEGLITFTRSVANFQPYNEFIYLFIFGGNACVRISSFSHTKISMDLNLLF